MDVFLVARVRSIFNLGDRVLWVQAQPSQYAISREMNSGQLVQMSVSKVFAPVDGWEMNIDRLDSELSSVIRSVSRAPKMKQRVELHAAGRKGDEDGALDTLFFHVKIGRNAKSRLRLRNAPNGDDLLAA
jgi:hypothetical protein